MGYMKISWSPKVRFSNCVFCSLSKPQRYSVHNDIIHRQLESSNNWQVGTSECFALLLWLSRQLQINFVSINNLIIQLIVSTLPQDLVHLSTVICPQLSFKKIMRRLRRNHTLYCYTSCTYLDKAEPCTIRTNQKEPSVW